MSGAPALVRGVPGRHYVWPPGKVPPDLVVPSVTTILDEYAKPWLGPWMAKAAGEYTADNLEALNNLDRAGVADLVARASRRESSASMGKGSAIHEALDGFIKTGKLPKFAMEEYPQVAAGIDFFKSSVGEVLYTESTIFSEQYQYAGTADLIAVLANTAPVPEDYRGAIAIIDWKSGARLYPEVALQLSGYANGDFLVNDEGEAEDMPMIEVGLAVHLPDNGSWHARPVELTAGLFKAFIALRTLTKFRAYVEPDVLGKGWKSKKQPKETEEE